MAVLHLTKALAAFATFAASAYVYDVLYLPNEMAKKARAAANTRRKPLLNIGAGTSSSSLRAKLFGPTLWGDVNLDIMGPEGAVGYGDIHDLSQFRDKQFGAVIASHVLEHVADPDKAVREMNRVADAVFIVVPKWWAPHTWLYHDHKWFISQYGMAYPLVWQKPQSLTPHRIAGRDR